MTERPAAATAVVGRVLGAMVDRGGGDLGDRAAAMVVLEGSEMLRGLVPLVDAGRAASGGLPELQPPSSAKAATMTAIPAVPRMIHRT
jgi:hypothetical protein